MSVSAPTQSRKRVLWAFGFATLAAILLADLDAVRPDPWNTLTAIGRGFVSPDFTTTGIWHGAALTIAFALVGVLVAAAVGLVLAPLYRNRVVRTVCIFARSIHELFWALLLMQITGLSPLTGLLAIGIPYTGIFAKVFSEYLDETDPEARRALPYGTDTVSAVLFTRLPLAWSNLRTYTLYRIECGLRSSAVLGFIGLPTLGYLLETYFRQAYYSQAAAVLLIFIALILPLRFWMRWKLIPLYLGASVWLLAAQTTPPMGDGALLRFLTQDIVPAPLRNGGEFWPWLWRILETQALPGAWTTIILAQVALALAALVAVFGFGLLVPRITGRIGAAVSHGVIVVLRSIPDYMLAFVFLQILGPSLLPAVLALGLHNGAIIAHLLGQQSRALPLRPDAPRGFSLWGYELLPRQSANIWALCLYRWEIIIRDSAIMGLLGIATLGFFIERNVQELRLDRVVLLLLVSVFLTFVIDALSTRLRTSMRLSLSPEAENRTHT